MDNVILISVSKHEFRQFLDSSIRQILAEQLPIDKSSTAIPNEILFLDEACTSTRLAKPIIYAKTSKGEIPHYKTGKKL